MVMRPAPVDAGIVFCRSDLPGIPASSLFGELVWRPRDGVSTGLEGQYRSKVYVEDSNAAKPAPSYAVFNWRAQFEQVQGPWSFRQLLRLDNLLDRQYVGSVIVGDSNGRFYEAAPGRSDSARSRGRNVVAIAGAPVGQNNVGRLLVGGGGGCRTRCGSRPHYFAAPRS